MLWSSLLVVDLLLLQIAQTEKLKPMEMELRMLEDLAESIVNDFAYMRAREEQMRDTNGMYSKYTIDGEIFAVKIFLRPSKFAKIAYAIFSQH